MINDLTTTEAAALAAIRRGVCDADELAPVVGATTGPGAFASLGRLIRCGLIRTVEIEGHALPWLALTDAGRALTRSVA